MGFSLSYSQKLVGYKLVMGKMTSKGKYVLKTFKKNTIKYLHV